MDAITYDTDFDLDSIARAIIAVGRQPLIARSGEDGNSFQLLLSNRDGVQLELSRPPAQSQMSAEAFFDSQSDIARYPIFEPVLLDTFEQHADELARSRIKSIMMVNLHTGVKGHFEAVELQLKGGTVVCRKKHSLDEFIFTGRHWVVVLIAP